MYPHTEEEARKRAEVLTKYVDWSLEEVLEAQHGALWDVFWFDDDSQFQVLTKKEIEALGLDPYHSSICQDDYYWIRTVRS